MKYYKYQNCIAQWSSILLYHGFAASSFNLEIMAHYEYDAVFEIGVYDSGFAYYQRMLNLVYEKFLNNDGDGQALLQRNITESSSCHYVLMALKNNLPHFLMNDKFLFQSKIKPHLMECILRSCRFQRLSAHWLTIVAPHSLYSTREEAEKALKKVALSEASILWSQARYFKIINLDKMTIEKYKQIW